MTPNKHLRLRSHTCLAMFAAVALIVACGAERFQNRTESEWRNAFEDGTVDERILAADALATMRANSDATLRLLRASLPDTTPAIRVAAARALASTGRVGPMRDSVLAILWVVAADSASDSRLSALEALALEPYRDARSVPVLIAALGDQSAGSRATAAVSLGILGSLAAPAIPALEAALRDTSEIVRHEIRDAIAAIGGRNPRH